MCLKYNRSIILLIILISTQLCAINSNVILNDNQSPVKRPLFGKVIAGKSDSFDPNININLNKRYDNKRYNYQKIGEQSKQQTLEPSDLKLYGYATAIDPRAHSYINPAQVANINPEYQYHSYQQLLNSMKMSDGINPFQIQQIAQQPNSEEEAIHVLKNYLKKYDMKKYFLKKILGDSYEKEEGHDEGFFANTHLRRHGTAGMAAKVFGELIGIKIRKTIENFGDSVSDYAKELTTNGFVTIGNSFNKLFRIS